MEEVLPSKGPGVQCVPHQIAYLSLPRPKPPHRVQDYRSRWYCRQEERVLKEDR